MTRRLLAFFVGLNVLGYLPPMFADEASKRTVEVVKTERVEFASGGVVRLNGTFSYLSVEGWDEPRVEITITKSTNRFYEPSRQEEGETAPGEHTGGHRTPS